MTILSITFCPIFALHDMWNFMNLSSRLNKLPIKFIGLVLCDQNLFKIIRSHDKLIERLKFILGQPFAALEHGRTNKSYLMVGQRFEMRLMAIHDEKVLYDSKCSSHDSTHHAMIKSVLNSYFMSFFNSFHVYEITESNCDEFLG